jgi:hypothetical protein
MILAFRGDRMFTKDVLVYQPAFRTSLEVNELERTKK